MEKKETAIHKIGRKTLDPAIRHEIDGWQPTSRSHRRRIISDSLYLPSRFTYYPRHIKQL